MTTVTILPCSGRGTATLYRAVAGCAESVGNTPGEALDAIAAKLDNSEHGTHVVIQQFTPDSFFTAEQQRRLDELMAFWRRARDSGASFPEVEQAELDALVDAELRGAGQRAAAHLRAASP